jgi:hypothetical protein
MNMISREEFSKAAAQFGEKSSLSENPESRQEAFVGDKPALLEF